MENDSCKKNETGINNKTKRKTKKKYLTPFSSPTLSFELNGTVINNTLLSIDETYSDSILTDLSIQYCDPSIYSIIVSGNNTVKVDIDDKVGNHMNHIIQTFYLP